MPRPREFQEQEALSAAADLFWRKGYEAASMQDLVEATGLNRASLYATFGGKQELFRKALRLFEDRSVERLLATAGRAAPGVEKIRAVFRQVAKETVEDARGCLMANSCTELSGREMWMAEIGLAARKRLETFFLACLQEAARAGQIRPGKARRGVARALLNTLLGLRVVAKMKPTPAVVRDIITESLAILS